VNKWYFICSILLIVVVGESIALLDLNNKCVSLYTEYDSLKEEYLGLTVAYDTLSQNYTSLETNYTNLESQYNSLQMDFAILTLNYSSLEANYIAAKIENSELKAQYLNLSIQFTDLAENYTALKNLCAQVVENYTILESQFIDLATNYTSLQAMCQSLQVNFTSLSEDYNKLQTRYDSLSSNYATLAEAYSTLEAQYSSLQALYEGLRAEYDRYVAAYQKLRDEINQRWNQQKGELFIVPTDSLVNVTVLSITGGWSDTSDWNEFWNDVKAMYKWVVNNIEYRYDGLFPMLPTDPSGKIDYWNEMWQFPNETLNLRKGDCEDMAILLCSMIRCYSNMVYVTECIGITSSTAGHLAVQIPVEGYKLVVFDPAGRYYSSDWLGNIVFNDISSEINNWLNYWEPQMGGDVYVDLVFSDYIHKTFTSTADYLSWMYSR
jgi:predicted nuclease with TOPRIM domain